MAELTIEQYEQIIPTCGVNFENQAIHYHTPNQMMRWRVDTLFTKEPDTIRWLSCFSENEVFIDIGANVGMYSLIAGVARKAKVFAFEPESQNYAYLNKNIHLNQAQDHIKAYCLALSDYSGLENFYLGRMETGGSCHAAGEALDFNLKPMQAEHIQGCVSETLDSLVSSGAIPVPHHIKIDVDGFEHKVIKGMQNTLQHPGLRSVLIELNPVLDEHQNLFDLMKKNGFSYFDVQMRESQQPDGPFKGIGNVIFYRKGWEEYEKLYKQQTQPIDVSSEFSHILERINKAEIYTDPSPYFFLENAFTEQFYQYLLNNIPDTSVYTPITETGMAQGDYVTRRILKMDGASFGQLSGRIRPFWLQFGLELLSDRFYLTLMDKFKQYIPESRDTEVLNTGLYREGMLIKDEQSYTLGPHTDTHDRVLSLLFYLPEDQSQIEAGTHFYKPKQKGFTSGGEKHYSFGDFEDFASVPFKPNSVLGFVRTDQSFHGVPEYQHKQTRDLLGFIVRNPKRIKDA
ncbi:MAG: FkbM family methyltransferase [bacterium]